MRAERFKIVRGALFLLLYVGLGWGVAHLGVALIERAAVKREAEAAHAAAAREIIALGGCVAGPAGLWCCSERCLRAAVEHFCGRRCTDPATYERDVVVACCGGECAAFDRSRRP